MGVSATVCQGTLLLVPYLILFDIDTEVQKFTNMSSATIELKFDRVSKTYQPGETVTGR